MYNVQAARDHLRLLTGSEDTPVTFQVFYDPKGHEPRPDLAQHFVGTLADNLDYFNAAQQSLCGIYVGINGSDGQGRKIENIVDFRTLFVDFDGQVEPTWPIQPKFVTKRDDTHGHGYFPITGIENAQQFSVLQHRIAISLGTDTQVIDPCRVARLCGSYHYKDPNNPQSYMVTTDNSDRVTEPYTVQQITDAFPLTAQQEAELDQWAKSREGIKDGTGFDNHPRYVDQFIDWCQRKAPPAILGSGTLTLYGASLWGYDRGISLDRCQELMWEHYNDRCEPRWEDAEREHFNDVIERAYHHSKSVPGCKTASAEFTAFGDVPEPLNGWDANKSLAPKVEAEPRITMDYEDSQQLVDRLTHEQGKILLSQCDQKSNHYDLAMAFDGCEFHGNRLYRWDKIFYRWNGKSWSVVSDDLLKAIITRFFASYKPVPKLVNGVFDVLCNISTVEKMESGTWVNDRNRDGSGVIVFKNGMIDINERNMTLTPHTPDFFTMNHLEFNYDPNAKCPTWNKFLDDLWDDDREMKRQLHQWMGYNLVQDVSRQKFAVFIGKSRGGKGVITSIMSAMVGQSRVAAPTLTSLSENHALHQMAHSQMTLIPDAHSVPNAKRDGVLSVLKAITGCDPISYDVKYKDGQNHVFKTHITLSTNNMPEFVDSSGALGNRMLVFTFNKSWAGRENVGLGAKLLSEIPGIMNESLAELRELNVDGYFTESEAGIAEKEELREDMFPLHDFVTEFCAVDPEAETPRKELYQAYVIHAKAQGVTSVYTETKFVRVLRSSSLPIHQRRTKRDGKPVKLLRGIRVTANLPALNNVTPFPAVPPKVQGAN